MRPKSTNDISQDIMSDLEAVGVTNISPMSPTGILTDRFSEYMSNIYNDVEQIDSETDISNISSDRLTSLAERHGISRTNVAPMRDDTFHNFNFYLANNAKAKSITVDITKGFTIPAGITIQTADGVVMYTADPAYFAPDDNACYVRIYAVEYTGNTSVSVNSIVQHNVSLSTIPNIDPAKITSAPLQCTNDSTVTSFSETLTDEDLRTLLRYEFNSLARINEDRLRLAVMSVAGVSDMKVVLNYNGIGNVGVIIVPVTKVASEGLYQAVEHSIRTNVIGGDTIKVIRPDYLSVFIKLAVQLKESVTDTDIVYGKIKVFTGEWVNNIDQGGELNPDTLEEDIRTAYSTFVDIVQVTCIYINNHRALVQTQSLFQEQKFIMYNALIDVAIN